MLQRRRVTIRGFVQGVGFRETVRQIALRYAVAGFVRNVGRDCVEIEAEGEAAELDAVVDAVIANPPPAARIDQVGVTALAPVGDRSFCVAPTTGR